MSCLRSLEYWVKKMADKKGFVENLWKNNPVLVQILGICSVLAVTNDLINTSIMAIGLVFVTGLSSLTVSFLRNRTPRNVRMIIQVLIIASYVVMVDTFLKAYLPDVSRALGPYVGLIITNCIIMGRAEAYAQSHGPMDSFIDGVSSGIGYGLVILMIAFVRELLGFGSIYGVRLLPETSTTWTIMIMPPSAFFVMALIIWIARTPFNKKPGKR